MMNPLEYAGRAILQIALFLPVKHGLLRVFALELFREDMFDATLHATDKLLE